MNFKLLMVLCAFFISNLMHATSWQDNQAIADLFAKANAQEGTFVLYDVKHDTFTGFNHTRAKTRFVPFSTFKIPNSLIGLSVGSVKNVDEIIPYDGQPRLMKSWEKDMDLRQAIKVSNVPFYQELARRTGLKRMQDALKKMDYGNAVIGKVVDHFWLDGPLKISAIEQTQFLKKLAQGTLPFPEEAQKAVQEITVQDKGDGWTLHYKTGSGNIGWWVGWVQQGDQLYPFALNMDEQGKDYAARLKKRVDLGRASLKELGLLK